MSRRKKGKPRDKEAPNAGWPEYLREGWSRGYGCWSHRYKQYLSSSQWQRFRAGVLARAEGKCALCESTERPLQAHHTHYLRVGCEQIEDVRALCETCHRRADQDRKNPTPIQLDATTRRIMRERAENPPPKVVPQRVVVRRRAIA